jgi:hypothetical protein
MLATVEPRYGDDKLEAVESEMGISWEGMRIIGGMKRGRRAIECSPPSSELQLADLVLGDVRFPHPTAYITFTHILAFTRHLHRLSGDVIGTTGQPASRRR